MKVFISHSWKNKTQAQKIADALQAAGVELWLDANNLLPGQAIQDTIDTVLEGMDMVVLLWSKEASESGGVAAEIYTTSRLQKLIIPCKLDSTPLDAFPYVKQIKGISFADLDGGIGRLKMVLLHYMASGLGMDKDEGMRALGEFMGTLEVTNHLVQKNDFGHGDENAVEANKDFWVNKIQNTHNNSLQKLKEMEEIGAEIKQFLSVKMEELQANINNRDVCFRILQELELHPHATVGGMPVFIEKMREICASFNTPEPNKAVADFRLQMEAKLQDAYTLMQQTTGWLIGNLFDASFEKMRYFYLSGATHLQALLDAVSAPGTQEIAKTASADLLRYIQTPGGIIDNQQFGILGYTDDVYLIHGIAYALHRDGYVDLSNVSIQWEDIEAGLAMAFNLIDAPTQERMQRERDAYYQGLLDQYFPKSENDLQWEALQKAKDELWQAKLTGLQGDISYAAGPYYP